MYKCEQNGLNKSGWFVLVCVYVCLFVCVSVCACACMPVCISVHSCSAGSHLNVHIATSDNR